MALFPKIKARLLPGRERQGRQEIRRKAPAVLALIPAAPLGKWETPWEGFFPPTSALWVMCWRPEPKSDPNPSAPSTEGPRLGLELFSMSWREKGTLRIRLGRSGLVWSLWQGSRGWSQAGDQCPVCSLAENPPHPPGRRILQTPVLLTEPGPSFCFGRALGMLSL